MLCAAEALVREDGFATLSVERVARQYLQPGKLVIIDAGDLAKAK